MCRSGRLLRVVKARCLAGLVRFAPYIDEKSGSMYEKSGSPPGMTWTT
jgi:hypothetical protein